MAEAAPILDPDALAAAAALAEAEVEADRNEWRLLLLAFRFAKNACDAFIDEGGLDTIAEFAMLPYLGFDRFIESTRKSTAAKVKLAFIPCNKMKACRLWVSTQLSRGMPYPATDFGPGNVAFWTERLEVLERNAKEAKDTNDAVSKLVPLRLLNEWPGFKDDFVQELARQRNVETAVPLTYLIRETVEVTVTVLERAMQDSATIDDDLVETTSHQWSHYRSDNKRLFELLYALVMGGPGEAFIKSYRRTHDGRGAFWALKQQLEGVSPARRKPTTPSQVRAIADVIASRTSNT